MSNEQIIEADRERFESEIRKINPKELFIERWPDGSYKHHGTECRWHGWQMARRAPAAAVDAEGLPPLPDAAWAAVDTLDGTVFHPSEDQAKRFSDEGEYTPYYTAEQVRQAQREAFDLGRTEGRRDQHETHVVLLGENLKLREAIAADRAQRPAEQKAHVLPQQGIQHDTTRQQEHTRPDHQGAAKNERHDAGATGPGGGAGAHQHHQHREAKSGGHGCVSSEDRGGAGVSDRGEVRAAVSAPSAAQEGRPLDVSTITSVVRQERTNSHAVIVRFRSERAADQFLDEFGTIVLGERAAAQEGKQSSAQGQGESK